MPKKIGANELDPVLRAVEDSPAGVSLEQIAKMLPLPRRTLQRRLAKLVSQERILLEGERRGSRYRLPFVIREDPPEIMPQPARAFDFQLSTAGQAIRYAVQAPIHQRHPVGYRRDFLDRYRPNETAYLPPSLRQHLAAVGGAVATELPAGTHARQVFNRLLIDLSWNSSRLEGNTYSLLETERLLELGESAEGRDAREARMILNHKAAIEMLVEQAEETGFNRYTIFNLHALLADSLLSNPKAYGCLRTIPVGIGGSAFHPLQNPEMIEECFDQILAKAAAIRDPFEQAFFVKVQIPYLQPFEDVNKRVARLAANIPLIRANVSPLSFVEVPARDYVDGILGVYELNRLELLRDVFVWAYERSCDRYAAVQQLLGDPDPFRLRYRKLLGQMVAAIIREKMDRIAAANFIRRQTDENVPTADRARVMEMTETEVMCLHEGNFARFGVRPSEYQAWRAAWR